MSEYMQAPEYLCGHMKSEIKDEKTLKLIDAAYNQGRRDQASHAVVDSVAADLADALRPLLEIERYNLPQCTEADTGGCHYAKECVGGCGTDEAWETYCKHRAALARYDALHKEAGQ